MPHSPRTYLVGEDIRYLRPSDLARFTGIDASNFSAWMHRRTISERILEQIAQRLRTNKAEVLLGFELKRQDVQAAQAAQRKAEQLILHPLEQESA